MKNTIQKTFKGLVVSAKAEKTLVVRVERTVVHPKYGKRYTRNKNYHVHDEGKEYIVGDMVVFHASRPYSKTKHWRAFSKKIN